MPEAKNPLVVPKGDSMSKVGGDHKKILNLMEHTIQIVEQRDLAVRRLLVVQGFLKNAVLTSDTAFGDGYSGRMLRAKAAILAGEFNPDDFLGKEDDPT